MRRLLRPVLCCALVLAAVPWGSGADALVTWRGVRVTAVSDGDTFDADTNGNGSTDTRVRMLGIQAMEIRDYAAKTGDCHAREAFRRLEALIEGKRVRLSANDPSSAGLKDRIQRFVAVRRNGAWRDVGAIMLREGHALWFPNHEEHTKNEAYQRAARRARARGVGLWDRDFCGRGPQQAAKLRLSVHWDADGADADNVNGEWVTITNAGRRTVRLGGWTLRDSALRVTHTHTSALRHYRFPAGTTVAAGRSIRVRVGIGVDSMSTVYWGLREPIFENAETGRRFMGDGAYLFDPDGDLRADDMYPSP